MLFIGGSLLLAVWLLGVVGVYDAGSLTHGFLLIGLMLLLMAAVTGLERVGRAP